MSDPVSNTQTTDDDAVTWLTRWLAERTPRRSFLGKVGRGLVASAVGGTAALSVFSESALASSCGYDHSVTCGCLTGHSGCPSGTCECGCWQTCGSRCPCGGSGNNVVNWCDCCSTS